MLRLRWRPFHFPKTRCRESCQQVAARFRVVLCASAFFIAAAAEAAPATSSGTTIGGKIIDDAGRPVPGATVTVALQEETDRGSWRSIERATLETGRDGRWEWTYRAAPEDFEHIVVGYYHPEYVSHAPGASSYIRERFKNRAELRAGSTRVLERGMPLEGMVFDAEGEPAMHATVEFGADRMVYNRVPEHLTGADGRFRLAVRPDEEVVLTVTHPGHAPKQVRGIANALPDPLLVQLSPAKTLRGQVVDTRGEPVRGARISVREWRDTSTIRQRLHTDREGRFEWDRAPEDPLVVSVLAPGYAASRDVTVQAGRENRIEIVSPPTVRGRVVDAETGEPVRSFHVTKPGNWYVGNETPEPLNWERDPDREFDVEDGSFEVGISGSYRLWAIRVEADGYRPAKSPIFAVADGDRELAFELEPAEWVAGRVTDPGGAAAAEADVFLVQSNGSLEMIDGELNHSRNVFQETTGSDGRFAFLPEDDPFLLVALHETGYAEVPGEELIDTDEIVLQPWARIEGEAKIRGAPADEHHVASRYSRRFRERHLYVSCEWRTSTDTDGAFVLDRVPPGEIRLSRMRPDGGSPWISRTAYQHPVDITVEAGETATVSLGGTGRPVVGRVGVDALQRLEWSAPLAEITRRTEEAPGEHRTVPSPQALYQFIVERDGSFRIEDLDSGDYSLRIRFREGPPRHRNIGTLAHDFTVPEADAPYSDEPLELPELEIEKVE